jgi:hypothetical protein
LAVRIWIGFVNNRSQRNPVLGGQILGSRQMSEKGRERAVAERFRERAEPPSNQLITIQLRGENVHVQRPVAAHVALGFHPVEELLHRGIQSGTPARIENVGQSPDRGGSLVPEDSQHPKL